MTVLPHPLAALAAQRPQAPVLAAGGAVDSAAAWAEAVAVRAGALAAAGIAGGSRVALIAPLDRNWVLDFHALGWLGAVAVPLDPNLPPGEHATALTATQPHCAILGSDCAGWRPALANADVDEVRASAGAAGVPAASWPLAAPRVVMLSSGSSGAPQATTLTTQQLFFNTMGSALRVGHLPDDRWLLCLPTHHVGGLAVLWRALWLGICVELHARFDAAAVAAALDAGRINVVSLVPQMLMRVLDARNAAAPFPAALRAVLVGGAPMPEALRRRCRGLQVPVALSYGATETASQVATAPPGWIPPAPAVGPPLPFVEVTAVDGRLHARGPAVGTTVALPDRGEVDADGVVHVHGRADRIIISGGKKIDPSELEETLSRVADVAACAVVPVADARWGQRPVAFVVPHGETADLEPACRAALADVARYKHPEHVFTVRALPRTALGKLRYGALADEAQMRTTDATASPDAAEQSQQSEGMCHA